MASSSTLNKCSCTEREESWITFHVHGICSKCHNAFQKHLLFYMNTFPFSPHNLSQYLLLLVSLMFIYFWETETECKWRKGRERGRHRIWSRLQAVSTQPDAGFELTNREIMTWAAVGCLTDWATQAPLTSSLSIHPLMDIWALSILWLLLIVLL